MASKSKRARRAPTRNLNKSLMFWAISVFAIKLFLILNIQVGIIEISGRPFIVDGIWLGADGENYLAAYSAILREGVFSPNTTLSYFPAGYPLVISALSIFGESWVLTTLSIFQSMIFSFSAYLFASQILRTRLRKFASIVFIFIALNPTLSLSSMVVGYESLTASGFLIVAGLMIKDCIEKNESKFIKYLVINSFIFGILTFVQPRLIVSGIAMNLIWMLSRKGIKTSSLLLIPILLITLLFPLALVYRNHQASGVNAISTNLGITMNIGAGDNATGGYMREGFGVPCNTSGTAAQQDNQTVKCVLSWYVTNPHKTGELFWNKSLYFWSPWFNNGFLGDVNTGTMSRNPWLKISPIKNIMNNPDGIKLVLGSFGKLLSWLWLLSGLASLFYGYLILWRQNSLEKFIGNLAMVVIATNWLITLFTIGDHRFRVPIMGLSLFLQAIGLKTLFKGGKPPIVDEPSLR
jgi:hypothetical protein